MLPDPSIKSPTDINEFVGQLISKINPDQEVIYIPVQLESDAVLQNCFGNVKNKITRDGGFIQYGWAVWQSDILCEAEFHAVWRSPEGSHIDITPREAEFNQILFILDNKIQYSGQLVDNVRVNITTNALVDDFIKLCETIQLIWSLGDRVTDQQVNITPQVHEIIKHLENMKHNLLIYIKEGKNRRSFCICGSGKKYKNCHGSNVNDELRATYLAAQRFSI